MTWTPPDGAWVSRFPDGTVAEEGCWQNGVQVGVWTRYSADGVLRWRCSYRDGAENGLRTLFFADGAKMEEGPVVDDERDGHWQSWHPNGQIMTEGQFRRDRKVGVWPVWDCAGALIDDGGLLPLPPGRGLVVLPGSHHEAEIRYRLGEDIAITLCAEDFSTGPLTADSAQLPALRADWWNRVMPDRRPPARPWAWDRDWQAHRQQAAAADWAELWVGHSVQEQVLLAVVSGLCRDLPNLSVRVFPPVKRMAMMSGLWLEDIHPPLPEAQPLSRWAGIWPVLTAPDPAGLADLVRSGTGSPAMDRALLAMTLRYPDRATGLGSMDRRLLKQVSTKWLKVARVVGWAMSDCDTADTVGDQVLLHRLIELGSIDPPLVTFAGLPQNMRHSECRLTDFGAACLAGDAQATTVSGWHDRIGGVTLTQDRLWYREDLS